MFRALDVMHIFECNAIGIIKLQTSVSFAIGNQRNSYSLWSVMLSTSLWEYRNEYVDSIFVIPVVSQHCQIKVFQFSMGFFLNKRFNSQYDKHQWNQVHLSDTHSLKSKQVVLHRNGRNSENIANIYHLKIICALSKDSTYTLFIG